MISYILLALALLVAGVYSIGLKPANARCKNKSTMEFFNGGVTLVATLCAIVLCAVRDSFAIPTTGVLIAAIFGFLFSMTVFLNLVALEFGPLSITNLIIHFSLVVPLTYSAIVYKEALTIPRIIGLALLVVCMVLFANSKKEDGKARSTVIWLLLALLALLCNGTISTIQKAYATATDNAYAPSFLMLGYLFATITSLLLGLILYLINKKNRTIAPIPAESTPVQADQYRYALVGWALLVGTANFGLNLIITLLATRLDAAIVYPVVQGGSPIIVAVASRVLFKEKITPIKLLAILLGCAAIVLLNL